LGDALLLSEPDRQSVAGDWSGLAPVTPAALVRPRTREDVIMLAREASRFEVGLVPRGAGTGKVGGAIPTEQQVVVDLSAMNRVLRFEPDDQYAVVQPGVLTAELDRLAASRGLMFPPDPASWETSTIGGNIATNAGGPRALKYGVTSRYVWGVELVTAGGEVLRSGRRSLKGVTGFDLTSLVVGSEGTLGIVTEATIHVIPRPRFVEGAWLGVSSALEAEHIARRIFSAGFTPRSLELLDEEALSAVGVEHTIPSAEPVAVHVELDGGSHSVRQELEDLCAAAAPASIHIADGDEERERFRALRRAASNALKRRYPFKLSDDIAVPRSQMHVFIDKARRLASENGLRIAAYGHLGDGNLHLNRLAATPEERIQAETLREPLLRLALSLGGTLTAEHGVGLTKRSALPLELSDEMIELQRRIKKTFDSDQM
ncbi:MAG: FAD-linked oxidase C-terminal domain-containing protein, partial [Myxococcota bacterium]